MNIIHSTQNYLYNYDYLVIGAGAAGLLAALHLSRLGNVALVSKGGFYDSNTYYAQGGIAGLIDVRDSADNYVRDTKIAGAGLCHTNIVQQVVDLSGTAIQELMSLGASFDTDADGNLHLTREGGHSHRRVVHATDATGRTISQTLLAQIRACNNITLLEYHMVVDLITARRLGRYGLGADRCFGAYILTPEHKVITLQAKDTILATGGAGKTYRYTSNPHSATGDGIAMAWRAGCSVMNMEFFQFHPTCLFHAEAPTFLLSEALRGEGGFLVDATGHRFVFDYDERGELAPRDVVARAIDHEMKKTGCDSMFLDVRHLGEKIITSHFPNIRQRLANIGIDCLQQTIPIVPAAHYLCGGVRTDLAGHTDIDGLYAIGETACTGFHGANRLASNSLLECLVMARLCAQAVAKKDQHNYIETSLPRWDDSGLQPEHERVAIKQNWDEIRATMSNYVGIVRSNARLRRARRRLDLVREEVASYYWRHPIGRDLIELRNVALVAHLIIACAIRRQESRGLHYSTDYPDVSEQAEDTILRPDIML
ncbi:MAG: L-aspartate oxidase [Mariprofundales bacterium]